MSSEDRHLGMEDQCNLRTHSSKVCDVQVCDSTCETSKANAKITNVKQSLAMLWFICQ